MGQIEMDNGDFNENGTVSARITGAKKRSYVE